MTGKVRFKRWRIWRSAVKAKKAEKHFNKKEKKMSTPMKPLVESSTTKRVAVSGGAVVGALAFIRNMWPDLLPWPPEQDATIAAALGAFIVPLISRLWAAKRG